MFNGSFPILGSQFKRDPKKYATDSGNSSSLSSGVLFMVTNFGSALLGAFVCVCVCA